MKAAEFQYERPADLATAIELMASDALDVAALAGGQSLMPMMNFRVAQPELVVDLADVAELRGVTRQEDAVRIGAMTRYAELEADAALMADLPLVAFALPFIAHSAIRNRGTLGGSLGLADPAAEMPAVMTALGAGLVVAGPGGERTIECADFFLGAYETALEPGELILAVEVPLAKGGDRFGFHEVARRHGDYAMAGVAIAQCGGDIRVVFFAVADGPPRLRAAETALLTGESGIDAAVTATSSLTVAEDLNASAAMKRHLAGVVLRRAWEGLSA